MNRRRHRPREIGFNFDSFLDLVANVVGIIVRLILVVWVGARAYSTIKPPPAEPPPPAEVKPLPPDPLSDELVARRKELDELLARLAAQLRELDFARGQEDTLGAELARLTEKQKALAGERASLEQSLAARAQGGKAVMLSDTELRERMKQVAEELKKLEKMPPLKKSLRYQTPVSRPVQAEELFFECQHGRVTFIDIATLLAELKRDFEDRSKDLRNQWEVNAVIGPVGPFKLRYVAERERGAFDGPLAGGRPDPQASFRASLSSWALEPTTDERGESLDVALAAKSDFRRIADAIDPRQSTVTFWVYPDSFEMYRKLRDYLYEHDVVVAGRPLPEGHPIASSRNGSVSRGQ